MSKISIIGACYNEENNIDDYLSRVKNILNKLNLDYQIILIDDGSKDNTWKKIYEHSLKDRNILGIKFSRNFGHQAALSCGIENAKNEYIFLSDVDLQDPPELLEKMYKKLISEELNFVQAKRAKNSESGFKKLSSIFFYKIFNLLSETKINEQVSDFVLFDKKIKKELLKINKINAFFRGLIPWVGFKSGYVEFVREKRKKGNSGYSLTKMINFSLNAFLSFSNHIIRLSFYFSILFFFIFILFFFYEFFYYLKENQTHQQSIFLLALLFFGSILFFILGIITELISRIYIVLEKRPNFVIDEYTIEYPYDH